MGSKEPKIIREQILIYMPLNIKEEIKAYAHNKGISVSSFMTYATIKLIEDIENGKVGIFELKNDMENKLSQYYRAPKKLVFFNSEHNDQNKEVIQK